MGASKLLRLDDRFQDAPRRAARRRWCVRPPGRFHNTLYDVRPHACLERVKNRFDLQPRRLAGDTVYGAVRLLKWWTVRSRRTSRSGTSRHAPMAPSAGPTSCSTDRAISTSAQRESCCIPPEQSSTAVRFAIVPQSAIAISARSKCSAAPTRLQARQIPRDVNEDAREVARALAKTEAFEQSRRERKKVVFCSHEANLQARPTSTARPERG
jgi:hypothetical protein